MPLDPVKPIYVRTTRPHRRRGRIGALIGFFLMLALVGGVLGSAAVYTNAFGVGERFDNLKDRVALFLNPPPDRDVPPDEEVTPPPDEADASEDPEARWSRRPVVSVAAGETPPPTPKPTPKPPKKKVDVDILKAAERRPEGLLQLRDRQGVVRPRGDPDHPGHPGPQERDGCLPAQARGPHR